MRSGTSLNIKFQQIQFIVWFLCRLAFAALVIYLLCELLGGAKQAEKL